MALSRTNVTPAAPGDGGEAGDELDEELPRVAEEEPVGGRAPGGLGEDTGQQRADEPAEAVRGDDVEGVVEAGPGAPDDREVGRERRDRAEREGGGGGDEAGRRSDRDEADHDAGRGADRRRLPVAGEVEERPDDERRGTGRGSC